MPIKPGNALITVGGTNLLTDAIRFTSDYQFFERQEFSNARLRAAPEANGQVPIIVTLPGGVPAQINDGCVALATRPLGADDPDLIFKRWDIKRWELQGAPTSASAVETVFSLHLTHKALLAKFDGHLQRARGNVAYSTLITMQAETFSYLTASGISMNGMPLGLGTDVTFTNILIVQFTPDVDYEEPLNSAGTSSNVLRRWSAVIEQRTLRNQIDSLF